MATAILVDGGFFLKRFRTCYPQRDFKDAAVVARTVFELALSHLEDKDVPAGKRELYRIFFYDCPPIQKKAHRPISRTSIDLAKSESAVFRLSLHDALRCTRKVALRLGHVSALNDWEVRPERLRLLLQGVIQVADLTDEDFVYSFRQKGVDMRLGLDIAAMAYKRQVDQDRSGRRRCGFCAGGKAGSARRYRFHP